ncbi:MAG: GGDEF domain-containing protein [Ruminococcus sp.]|nr:GGDEF domain-containing protein [Ruminococcus sp.]
MSKNDPSTSELKNITRLKILMIIGYALIIVFAISIVSLLSVHKTDSVLKNKVTSMASSLNLQMKLNMDSYLQRMETVGTLVFAYDEIYTYDATDPSNDEFESLSTEKNISDKLYSLCIMENFVDYGIVYRNNHTVGKISNGTSYLFGENLFHDMESRITKKRTSDGWFTGYNNDFKRIYYVKRLNDNSLLILSFYASELESVFDNPETLDDMDVRLTDNSYNIIYSSAKDEVGNSLPYDIRARITYKSSATFMDNQYLITVNSCEEGWFVICSIPTQIILKEKNEMRYYIYMIAGLASLLAILIGIELSIRLTEPVKRSFSYLDLKSQMDQLTGILNKKAFEDYTAHRLENASPEEVLAMVLVDLDNFKGVNDTLGHAVGDQVLAKIGSILRGVFSPEDFIGRIGGDEFCVFVHNFPKDTDRREFITAKCEAICAAFRNNYTGKDGKYKVSGSIGVAMFPGNGNSFEELYKASDTALYYSKKNGKDTYNFYDPSMSEEEAEK